MNGYSHLLNGSSEACLQRQKVGGASVVHTEGIGSSCNHFGSSWDLGDFAFAAALRAAAHGDASRLIFRQSTDDLSSIVASSELKECGTRLYSSRSFILYRFYIVYPIALIFF